MSDQNLLYSVDGDERAEFGPDELLERIWDLADPALPSGHTVVVDVHECVAPVEALRDWSFLVEYMHESIWEVFGEDASDTIKLDVPEVEQAAKALVGAVAKQCSGWRASGKRVGREKWVLADAETGRWERATPAMRESTEGES